MAEDVKSPVEVCRNCCEALQLLGRLVQLVDNAHQVQLIGVPYEAESGKSTGPASLFGCLQVHCKRCLNTRYVLSEAGLKMAMLLQRQGYLPAGPLPAVQAPAAPDSVVGEEIPF